MTFVIRQGAVIDKEEAYRVRLERHYDEVKKYMVDHPDSTLHEDVLLARRNMERIVAKLIGNPSMTRSIHKQRNREMAKRR